MVQNKIRVLKNEMDDLIVIILTLVFAVVGALGQIKKKKQEATVSEHQPESDDFWEAFEEEKPEVSYNSETVTLNNDFVPETEKEPEDRSIAYYIKQNKKTIFEENIKRENKRQKSTTFGKEKFSLRKAVIYSEILNRKYT